MYKQPLVYVQWLNIHFLAKPYSNKFEQFCQTLFGELTAVSWLQFLINMMIGTKREAIYSYVANTFVRIS